MPRVLLLLPTTTYRTQSFVEAALRESHSKLEFVIEPAVDRTREDGRTSLAVESTEDL